MNSSNKRPNIIERTMVVLGIVGPFAALPQVIKVYTTHPEHAAGHSLLSWSLFFFLSTSWMLYGIYHKNPAIYVGNAIGSVLNALLVVGIYMNAGITY